jgi:hypothetical protein
MRRNNSSGLALDKMQNLLDAPRAEPPDGFRHFSPEQRRPGSVNTTTSPGTAFSDPHAVRDDPTPPPRLGGAWGNLRKSLIVGDKSPVAARPAARPVVIGNPFAKDPSDHHDEMGDPRFTDPETGHMFQSQQDLVIWELLQGNRQYVKWLSNHDKAAESMLEHTPELSTANLKQVGYLSV